MGEQLKTDIEHFAEIVRRYCTCAESSFVDVNVDMQAAQKLLAELNSFVLDLPDDEFEDNDVELENISIE